MPEPISLIKANPLLPAEDYGALRKQGIKHIEKLGSALWTDYNNSDPGITMLEAVCYAITDLAYRTGFEVKDLLAPEQLTPGTWDQIFYTAKQILHNNALTLEDYRKLIIDIRGVRNAWIQPSKDYEVPVWIDYNAVQTVKDNECSCADQKEKICFGKLGLNPIDEAQYQKEWEKQKKDSITQLEKINKQIAETTGKERQELLEKREKIVEQLHLVSRPTYPSKIVEFEGLYNVMVEYEEDILEDEQREVVRQKVIDRLSQHRNLCEDFLSIDAVEYEDFGIGASVVLEEYADPDLVLAEIYFTIYKYFTPSIPFHTIAQMMEKGYQADEIFEGPLLKHGFIESSDLEKTDFFRDIHLSDLIDQIASIKGIKAITYFHLPFHGFDQDTHKFYFNRWITYLKEERKIARIQPALSQVLFCKERDFISFNTNAATDRRLDRALKLFKDLKAAERAYKLKAPENDFPVPTGTNMELEDYYPVTYSLPHCYGVSDRAGLPANADDKRKAQALQLRGYMLFFEQILADHLVQLNHLRCLFSFDDSVKHTYFTRALTEIEGLQELLVDYGNHGMDHVKQIVDDFSHVLQNLTETPELFHKRRNQFLDHLLARFSEDMSEYEAISRWLTPYKVEERLIRDKIAMLKDGEYYRISTNRSIGYNYAQNDYWDSANVSGTERRVGRLLGFTDITRRTLAPTAIIVEPVMEIHPKTKQPVQKANKKGDKLNVIKLFDQDRENTILLTSVEVKEGCCTEELLMQILVHADNRKFFKFHDELKQRSRKSAGLIGTFWFELYDSVDYETAVLLGSSERFDKKEHREHAFKELQKLMTAINDNEGMHLVEHLLLRPKFDEMLDEIGKEIPVSLFDICLDNCDRGKGLGEGTEIPRYRMKTHRIPASKCYDKLPWVLEYFRFNPGTKKYDQSILFQKTFPKENTAAIPLKFRRYEAMSKRISDLREYGSEHVNYEILSNGAESGAKYSFIIHGNHGEVLAQSPFMFNKRTGSAAVQDDIEKEMYDLMRYFEFQLDLYCDENPCDHNEDPYSFRTTIVLPCWPKRFRDPTFRNLVEKTIYAESPAHVHHRIEWLGISEMQRFEKAYNTWLLEMAQTEMPGYEMVNPLVDTLKTLVPCGKCHEDCSADAKQESKQDFVKDIVKDE